MIKKIGIAFLLALAAGWLSAQNTAVTAQVIDGDNQQWFGGTWKITFVPNPQNPNIALYNINGTPLNNSVLFQNGIMDSGGNLAIFIYQSTAISPANSSWQLTICPQAITQCGVYNFATSTNTLNLTSVLTTVIPSPRFHAIAGAFGYSDTEASLQLGIGNTYYNVSSLCQRYYNGSSWSCTGGSTTVVTMTGDVTGPSNANILSAIQGIAVPTASTGFFLFSGGSFSWHPLVAADINAVGGITNNTSGNAATSTLAATASLAIAANTAPTGCPSGEAPQGIDIHWNFTGCQTVGGGGSGVNGAVYTSSWTAVAAQPAQANCSGACTMTLPSSISTGFSGTVCNINASNNLTIASGGPSYDGYTTLTPFTCLGFWTDGTNYHSSNPQIQSRKSGTNGFYKEDADGTFTEYVNTGSLSNNTPTTVLLPHSIPNAIDSIVCSDNGGRVQSGNNQPVGANVVGQTAPFTSFSANTPATGVSAYCIVVGH